MYTINILLQDDNYSSQLDTIEEKSDEGTPQFEISAHDSKVVSKKISNLFADLPKPNFEPVSENLKIGKGKKKFNDAEFIKLKNNSIEGLLQNIIQLQETSEKLHNSLKNNQKIIKITESENEKLFEKIENFKSHLENIKKDCNLKQSCSII